MTAPRKADPRIKVKWAKDHIRQLDESITAFMGEPRPYEIIDQFDPQTGKSVHSIRLTREIPTDIQCLTGDILHNLRSALDHLLYRLMPVPWKRSHMFPIYGTAKEFEDRLLGKRGKVQGLPDKLVQRIRTLKPYKGGNDALWRLNELNNIDKHRLLVAIAIAHDFRWLDLPKAMGFQRLMGLPWLLFLSEEGAIVPMEDGAVLAREPPWSKVDVNNQFPLLIAFDEPQIIEAQAVIPALVQFADLVEGVIAIFDDIP